MGSTAPAEIRRLILRVIIERAEGGVQAKPAFPEGLRAGAAHVAAAWLRSRTVSGVIGASPFSRHPWRLAQRATVLRPEDRRARRSEALGAGASGPLERGGGHLRLDRLLDELHRRPDDERRSSSVVLLRAVDADARPLHGVYAYADDLRLTQLGDLADAYAAGCDVRIVLVRSGGRQGRPADPVETYAELRSLRAAPDRRELRAAGDDLAGIDLALAHVEEARGGEITLAGRHYTYRQLRRHRHDLIAALPFVRAPRRTPTRDASERETADALVLIDLIRAATASLPDDLPVARIPLVVRGRFVRLDGVFGRRLDADEKSATIGRMRERWAEPSWRPVCWRHDGMRVVDRAGRVRLVAPDALLIPRRALAEAVVAWTRERGNAPTA